MITSLLDNLRSTSPKFSSAGSSGISAEKLSNSDSGVGGGGNRSGYASCEEEQQHSTGSSEQQQQQHSNSGKIGIKFPFTSGSSTGGNTSSSTTSSSGGVSEVKKNSSGGDHSSASNSPMGSFKATSSKKGEKVLDILSWDLALIKAELEALRALQADCMGAFAQVGLLGVFWEFI